MTIEQGFKLPLTDIDVCILYRPILLSKVHLNRRLPGRRRIHSYRLQMCSVERNCRYLVAVFTRATYRIRIERS